MVKNAIFLPDQFLKKAFPKDFWEKRFATESTLNIKKYVIQALKKGDLVSEVDIQTTVNKVLKYYKQKFKQLPAEEFNEMISKQSLLKDRLENLAVYNEVQKIKEVSEGKYYRWLPSDAEHPDPEHQLLYGQIFRIGEGDKDGNMPSERYGCRCGMEILDVEDVEEFQKKNIDKVIEL